MSGQLCSPDTVYDKEEAVARVGESVAADGIFLDLLLLLVFLFLTSSPTP